MGAAVARAHITMNMLALLGAAALIGNGVFVVARLIGTWRSVDAARGVMADMPTLSSFHLSPGWPWGHLVVCTILAAGVVLTALYGVGAGATALRSIARRG